MLRTLRHNDVGNDASNDDKQCPDVVEVVVNQVNEIAKDEHQCAEHDKDDTQILFLHSCIIFCVRICLFALQRYKKNKNNEVRVKKNFLYSLFILYFSLFILRAATISSSSAEVLQTSSAP